MREWMPVSKFPCWEIGYSYSDPNLEDPVIKYVFVYAATEDQAIVHFSREWWHNQYIGVTSIREVNP